MIFYCTLVMRSSEVLEGAHQCHFLFKLYLDQYKTLISVYLFNNFKETGYLEILLYHTNSKDCIKYLRSFIWILVIYHKRMTSLLDKSQWKGSCAYYVFIENSLHGIWWWFEYQELYGQHDVTLGSFFLLHHEISYLELWAKNSTISLYLVTYN